MTPLKSTIDQEVMAVQAAAYSPEKTHVSTITLLDWVREHPAEFPELSRRTDKSIKMEISRALLRLGFTSYSSARHNHSGNRAFCRPAQLRTPASPGEAQLSAAGGGL